MVLTFLLFTFLASSTGGPLTPNSPHSTGAEADDSSSVFILGRDLPECLKFNNYRTTSQIVWSCLATIFACTWVAIHPNLPGPRDSGFQCFKRRVTIAILAIIAPELIVAFATGQLAAAKMIKREFNVRFNNGDDPELSPLEAVTSCFTSLFHAIKEWFVGRPNKANRKWTLTHGFFVQMGGFMMYHEGEPVQVLTFDRLLKAIERGEIDIPYIPEEDILDKSKGDGLSKLIVVLQTTWFVAQCLGRWISQLPISELEVSTLAFAVLNAYVYAIWWSKPQGVLVPIKLEFKARPLPSNDSPSTSQPSSSPPPPCSSESSHTEEPLLAPTISFSDAESTLLLVRREDDQWEQSLRPVVEVESDKGSCHWIRDKIAKLPPYSRGHPKRIWELFLHLVFSFGIILLYSFQQPKKLINGSTRVGRSRIPMFYMDRYHFPKFSITIALSIFIIPPIFGGIHLTLWSAPFPTSLEQLLWKISAVYITIAPLLAAAVELVGYVLQNTPGSYTIPDADYVLFCFITFPYPIARCILIFISFYTLPHLPQGAYYDVQWSTLLPHF